MAAIDRPRNPSATCSSKLFRLLSALIMACRKWQWLDWIEIRRSIREMGMHEPRLLTALLILLFAAQAAAYWGSPPTPGFAPYPQIGGFNAGIPPGGSDFCNRCGCCAETPTIFNWAGPYPPQSPGNVYAPFSGGYLGPYRPAVPDAQDYRAPAGLPNDR